MANSAGLCSSAKSEFMMAVHALGPGAGIPAHTATTPDVVKAALFTVAASPSRSVADTVYNTTGELTGTNYTAGGITVTMGTAPSTSGTAGIFTPSVNFVWSNLTSNAAFDCVVLYNSSQGSKELSVHIFGSQNITAGTLTLTMPANAPGTALLQIT